MDYEELAKGFCRLKNLRGIRIQTLERPISVSGENGVLLYMFDTAGDRKKVLPGDLVKELGISFGRITNILKVLERKGYVQKHQDTIDRRRVYVSLTDDGERYISGRYQEAVHYFAGLFEELGEKDAAEYFRITLHIHEICERQMKEKQAKCRKENQKGYVQKYV